MDIAHMLFCAGLIMLSFQANVFAQEYRAETCSEFAEAMYAAEEKNSSDLQICNDDAFPLNRLLVISDEAIDCSNAADTIRFMSNYYVMFYESKEEAEQDYHRLKSENNAYVILDSYITACDDGSAGYSYLSWGPEYIGAREFNDLLIKKYGDIDNLPEIKVAVADTGINYNHPFFKDRVDMENAYNFVDGTNNPMDDHYASHGTHVSGIICDTTLPNVKIMPYKVMNSKGRGSMANMLASLIAAAEAGADVMNFSLGGVLESLDITEDDMRIVKKAAGDGVVIVSASGNVNDYNYKEFFPVCAEGVIGVANCTDDNNIYISSNSGYFVDVAAPGYVIRSTIGNNTFGTKTGTSMACPFVSAAAAMIKTYNRDFTSDSVERMLEDTAEDILEPGYDIYSGWGIINLKELSKSNELNNIAYIDTDENNDLVITSKVGTDIPCTMWIAGYENNILSNIYKENVLLASKPITYNLDNDRDLNIFLWGDMQQPCADLYKYKSVSLTPENEQ